MGILFQHPPRNSFLTTLSFAQTCVPAACTVAARSVRRMKKKESVRAIGAEVVVKQGSVTWQAITKNGPYTWGNFHACAITKFEKPQQLGRACSSVTTCAAASRASPCPVSAGCCGMQAAAETTASGSTGKEDLKADRRVRHYKEVGLPEWPLAGRATVPRGLWYRSLHVSSSERFFQKVYGRPLPWTSPFTLFARLTEPQVVVLP